MPRNARFAPGGMVLHALNRRVSKETIFRNTSDYLVFENILQENVVRFRMRLLGYCLMPNHWHMSVWPRCDGDLSKFMHRVELTHAVRWKLTYDAVGDGHLYQNRYKSFPVESDEHYLTVLRYVERNALRANLVRRAEDWRFSSLWRRVRLAPGDDTLLSPGPLDLPADWVEYVNQPQTAAELEALRDSVDGGKPFGTEAWKKAEVPDLRVTSNARPRGRPKKKS